MFDLIAVTLPTQAEDAPPQVVLRLVHHLDRLDDDHLLHLWRGGGGLHEEEEEVAGGGRRGGQRGHRGSAAGWGH